MKTLKAKCDLNSIRTAVTIIKKGGIVVFPTDTVYGIGCDPYNKKAVQAIYRIKNRDPIKQFPILGFSKNVLSKIAIFDKLTNKIAEKFWPGPITIILPLKDKKLKKSMNLDKKIAVRVPNNQCALDLLEQCNLLIGTSANISNSTSYRDPKEFEKKFTVYDFLLDGGIIPSTTESTIIEINKKGIKIHREGSISKQEILHIL